MIQIGLTTALLIYGGMLLFGFVLMYVASELRASRMYRVLEKQFLWRCTFCGYLYLDEDAIALSQCPRCTSFNAMDDAQDRAVTSSKQRLGVAGPEAEQDTEKADDAMPRRNPARKKRHGQSHRGPRRRR